jgi:transposase-like protein
MTERELERRANRRLAVLRDVEEVSGNVAATCRYYGISRQCYYGWLRRYEADGLAGLKDRSQRPHHSPRPPKPTSWRRSSGCGSTITPAQPRSLCT